jgi:protocatechuate 3,4-dioxygenase beta subunit
MKTPHRYQLTRREVLGLVASAGAVVIAGCGGGGSSGTPTDTPAPTATGTSPPASTNTAVARTSTPTAAATAAASATPTVPASGTPAASATPTPTATPSPAGATASPTLSTLSCIVRPEETEGPYFVDELLNRSDIRSDPSDGTVKDGVPLQLTFRVAQVSGSTCSALAGVTVDVWHCDALGVYSDVSDPSFNTVGQKFLRGYQVTDANGVVQFTTIYPGWYQGRTVHVHFKIRNAEQTYDFTSQVFFDDALTDVIDAMEPYASKGQRTLRNAGDNIYQSGGDQLLLSLTPSGDGYAATFDIGLQLG